MNKKWLLLSWRQPKRHSYHRCMGICIYFELSPHELLPMEIWSFGITNLHSVNVCGFLHYHFIIFWYIPTNLGLPWSLIHTHTSYLLYQDISYKTTFYKIPSSLIERKCIVFIENEYDFWRQTFTVMFFKWKILYMYFYITVTISIFFITLYNQRYVT